jgi:predicted tellurium resistance membrane protein TerC
MEAIFTSENLISLFTLTLLEVVLGIDNIIFISILSNKLPADQEPKARNIGLLLALILRLILLGGISIIIGLQETLFQLFDKDISGKDLILLIGGLFLIAKSTTEIHGKLEGAEESGNHKKGKNSALVSTIIQIGLINLVFSFDSILTAIGLVKEIWVMMVAVLGSTAIMYFFAKPVNDFINKHPTFKILALSFLIMIGFLLALEAFDVHVDKGYVYFAMAFAFIIELINMRIRKKAEPVQLRNQTLE